MSSAILFDLDDTLYLERDYVSSGFKAAAAFLNQQGLAESGHTVQQFESLFDSGFRANTFDQWAEASGLPELVPELVRVYREHTPTIRLQPGASDALHLARTMGKTGIVTDGGLSAQQRKVAALGVGDLVDVVVFSDQWGRESWKPSPTPFLKALEQCGGSPTNSVYIADNPAKDFVGARALGMRTIRLRLAGGLHFGVEPMSTDHAADLEFHAMMDLVHAMPTLCFK